MPSLDFTLEQQRILDCTSENIIVSACAGSGKSSTLVEKAKREILLSRPWKKLAVLTFTNKSKDDLISKVNHPSIIITTFHGFIFENVFPFDPYFCNEVRESFQKRANTYIEWLDAFKNNNLGESMQVLVGTGINETPEWQDIQLPLPTGNTRKRTGIDAGVLNERSVTDDYEYICIQGGEVGVAIWKKQPLSIS